jgi:hypothetical protein
MNAEADQVQTDAVDYVSEAKAIGWVDQPEFKGDPQKWVDAKTYITRGKEYIPFLKASQRKLEAEVQVLRNELQGAKRLLTANEKALGEIKETTAEAAKAATESELTALRAQIVEARRAGEIEREEELRDKLEETRLKLRQPAPASEKPAAPAYENDPTWKQFLTDNPWWESDPVMRAASLEVSKQLAAAGDLNDLTPQQRFQKIAAETRKRFGQANNRRQEPSRVGGTRTTPASGEGGTSFADLPQDAKDACVRLEARFVGPGKKFKTPDEWHADYTRTYFGVQ